MTPALSHIYPFDTAGIRAIARETGADDDDIIAEVWLALQRGRELGIAEAEIAAWAYTRALRVLSREMRPTAGVSLDADDAPEIAAEAEADETPFSRADYVRAVAAQARVSLRAAQGRVKRALDTASVQPDLFVGGAV